jgi:hypothetical protein
LGKLTEGGDKELISMSFWIGLVSERFMLMGCDLGTLLLTTVCQKKKQLLESTFSDQLAQQLVLSHRKNF